VAKPTPDICGTEEGWTAASSDSRRAQKQKDIKALVGRQVAYQKGVEKEWEDRFEDDLIELCGPVVHAGFERKGSTLGYSRSYSRNYAKVFGGS
jgi:hypothetical protein